jgi:uncharacterized protein YacL
MALAALRVGVIALCAWGGAELARALGPPALSGALGGVVLGSLAVWLETRLARIPVQPLLRGAAGGVVGLVGGLAVGITVALLVPGIGTVAVGLPALLGVYLGTAAAVRRRADLPPGAGVGDLASQGAEPVKVVDTSVIIDGRIGDLCETGFVEGRLVVPQFVLHELQQIADSPDALRRTRGRRGFEVLQRLQRCARITVEITQRDVPHVRDVDRKVIELARALGGKVLTNDSGLARVAELNGVAVLNVNELAHALKPVVLPGEAMQVHVLREGREAGQGVAYLDDGTMVVVDRGRSHLGQTVGVTVTSVLQTTAGRMIFTRLREGEPVAESRGA